MRDLTTWDKSWPGALLRTARGSTGSGDGVSVGMGVSVRMGVSAGPLRGSAMSKHSRSPEDVDSSSCDQLHHT